MLIRNIALVNTTKNIAASEIALTASAIQKQVTRDFGPIWSILATVDFFPDIKSVPVGYWPVIISDHIDEPGAAGFHTDKHNQPYALVQYDETWQLTCSHEILEMLVDPYGNKMVASDSIDPDHPAKVNYLVEVCDPCEDISFAYSVNGILLSDFYTPHYFDPVVSTSTRYSFTGALDSPRQIKRNGYLSWYNPILNKWYQATYFGTSLSINPLDGMKNNGQSLRSQIDKLTINPNKFSTGKEMLIKHRVLAGQNFASSVAAAKFRTDEITESGFMTFD